MASSSSRKSFILILCCVCVCPPTGQFPTRPSSSQRKYVLRNPQSRSRGPFGLSSPFISQRSLPFHSLPPPSSLLTVLVALMEPHACSLRQPTSPRQLCIQPSDSYLHLSITPPPVVCHISHGPTLMILARTRALLLSNAGPNSTCS